MKISGVYTATVVLIPGFSMMALSSLIEPMRGANRIAGVELFRWRLLSSTGAPVAASNGIEIKTLPLSAQDDGSNLAVLCGGHEDEAYTDPRVREFLRRLARRDTMIGSLSTGTFMLAEAGLLEGRRCTTHWNYVDALKERYPDLDVCNDIFVIDRRGFTCGGGVAAMDVMLEIIRGLHGTPFTNRVSENFIYGGLRNHDHNQRMSLRERLGVPRGSLIKAVELMEANIESPLRVAALARRVRISERQLERLFESWLGVSPTRYYVRLRLDRARALLRYTSIPVFEAAVACGFTSASHFSRAYKNRFGCSPTMDQRNGAKADVQPADEPYRH